MPSTSLLRDPALAWTVARPRRTLLVLSHMRSYSTLLCHILGSNPEVDGYVELHRRYAGRSDLYRLRAQVARMNETKLQGRYVLDKVLHYKWEISDDVLHSASVYTVFSVREPEATIKSTVAMALSGDNPDKNWKSDIEKVGRYYVERCEGLVALAERTPRHSSFFVAERLIDRSEETLAMLTDYLGLATPLTPSYDRFSNTRKRGFGDPSENIAAGEIKKDRTRHDVEVPEHVLAPCREAYASSVERLLALTGTTLPADRA